MKNFSTSDILTILSGYNLTARMFGENVQISGTVDEIKRLIRSGELNCTRAVSCNGGPLTDIGINQHPLSCSLAIVGECSEQACYGVYLLTGDTKLFLKATGIGK
jgi:hypothetical protein